MKMKYHPKEVYYESRGNVHYIVLVYENSKVEHVIVAQQFHVHQKNVICPACHGEEPTPFTTAQTE